MRQKGQITLFIVIGIAVLITAAILIYFFTGTEKTTAPENLDIGPLQSFISSCLKATLDDGVDYISLQGGYYIVPEDRITHLGFDIPYYHDYEKGDLMPALGTIEDQLDMYIKGNLDSCLNDFTQFRQTGYGITAGKKDLAAAITDEGVTVEMKYPITAKKGEQAATIEDFSTSTTVPLKNVYLNVRRYINKQIETPNSEPLSYLMQLAYEYDFTFENIFRQDSYIYGIITEHTDPLKDKYVFLFAIKYDWSDLGVGTS